MIKSIDTGPREPLSPVVRNSLTARAEEAPAQVSHQAADEKADGEDERVKSRPVTGRAGE